MSVPEFELNLERVYIRSIRVSDAAVIAQWKSDPLFRKMSTGTAAIINEGNQRQDIEKSIKLPSETYVMIVEKESMKPVGYVRFNWMGGTRRFGWLRFGLGEQRGKGYMREALSGIFHHLFQEETHRIDAEVYEYNERSLHLLKSLGFIKEGTRRLAYFDDERYFDIEVLGLLQSDWMENKSRSKNRAAVK